MFCLCGDKMGVARAISAALLTLLISVASSLPAQAFNALRDPKNSVFRAFPEASGYKCIIRPVTGVNRALVLKRLPFRIHFNELGDHALYAAFRGERPVGIVHARSEESRWGFAEIAWALDLDLRIRGFKFHRCRNKHRDALETSVFAKSLQGLGGDKLAKLLTPENEVRPGARGIPRGARRLAGVVLRSAIKTIALTRTAWHQDLRRLRGIDMGLSEIPAGEFVRELAVSPTAAPPSQPSSSKPPRGGAFAPGLRVIRAVDVQDRLGTPLGRVVECEVQYGQLDLHLRFTISPDGRIRRVNPLDRSWPDAGIRASFTGLEGRRPLDQENSNTTMHRLARRLVDHVRGLTIKGDSPR